MSALRLMMAGHRTAGVAYLTIFTLITGLAGAIIGTAVSATEKSDELRGSDVVTVDTAAEWADYQGTADYTFMVAAIVCVVGLILLASASQFVVSSFGTTYRRLRMLGASRHSVRRGLAFAAAVIGSVALLPAMLLSPGLAVLYRQILGRIGLATTGLGSSCAAAPTLIAGLCLAGWGIVAVWWQARRLAGLGDDASRMTWAHRIRNLAAVPFRYGVGVGAAAGLWGMDRAGMTLENFNEMSFGIALCALLLAWSLTSPVLRGIGWVLRRGGTGRMITGGVTGQHSRRVGGVSLVSAVVIVLGGAAAFAALTSSTGDAYRSLASLRADAVTDRTLSERQFASAREAGFRISPLDTDGGWLEGSASVDIVQVHRIDPDSMAALLAPGVVSAGSLEDIGGNRVGADDSRSVGDTLHLRDGRGEQRTVTVVATFDRHSALGGGVTVDEATFPVSSTGQLRGTSERTYVSGAVDVRTILPDVDWMDPRDTAEETIEAAQERQLDSLTGMVGGIGVVAVIALIHATIGFVSDLRGTQTRMRRLSFSWLRVTGVFSGLGAVTGVSAGVMAVLSLWTVQRNLTGMLADDVPGASLPVPWSLIAGLWGTVAVAGIAGAVTQPLSAALRDRRASTGS